MDIRPRLIRPYTTSTARLMVLRLATTSDTGTVAVTGRALDLSRAEHVGATGGKPLDVTVHRRRTVPRYEAIGVSVPLELSYNTSGKNLFVTATHQHRGATAGTSSTYATIKTETKRYKMGTDTDGVFHHGFESLVSAMAIKRFYRCNLTFGFRLATDTAGKDTTTDIRFVCNSPVYVIVAGDNSPTVPA